MSAPNTRRLAKNTLMLYARMLFGVLVSIYSSRVIVAALGFDDYGIYNTVGGVVSMFSIVTSSLSSASSRFLTFALGKGDRDLLNKTFSISLNIHILLAAVAFVLIEIIGVWYLNTRLNIPESRIFAANMVLQCAMVTFLTSIMTVPFNAAIISHEKMGFFAYTSIAEILLKLGVAIMLAYGDFGGDKLILYSVLLVLSTLLIQIVYYFFCRRSFEECKFRTVFDRGIIKDMLGFASWNFFGSTVGVLNNYGINNIMFNVYGPAVSAARGLALTVSNIVANFVNNFMMALNPQITKSYAQNEGGDVINLVERGGKFSLFILLMMGLPVFFETDFLVNLWLVEVPEHLTNFIRLILILAFTDVLSNVLGMAQNATGKIKNYQIVTSMVLSVNFLLSYILLKDGIQPEYTYVISITISVALMVIRLLFVRKSIGLSLKDYFKNVYLRILVVFPASIIIPLTLLLTMPDGWIRFFIVSTASCISVAVSVISLGCTANERAAIFNWTKTFLKKIIS